MKNLRFSERAIAPANNPAPPVVIVIDDPATAQQLLTQASTTPLQQHSPAPLYKPTRRQSRLRQLINEERNILEDAFEDFTGATKHLIGTLITWLVWRIVVPLSVLSAVWTFVASSAELPV